MMFIIIQTKALPRPPPCEQKRVMNMTYCDRFEKFRGAGERGRGRVDQRAALMCMYVYIDSCPSPSRNTNISGQGSKRLDSRMSPHAAKARGIFDRGAAAPIGGHEGIPDDSPHQVMMGSAQGTDENNEALIAELSLFDTGAGAGEGDGGGVAGTDELGMAWSGSRMVRSASMSSTGSGDAEESEVRLRC